MPKARVPMEERFKSRIQVDPETGCWEWQGPRRPDGYGAIGEGGRGGKIVRTHRYSYELHKGPIPDGLHIDHLCRNRGCCNPDHLEAVPQAENNRRAFANYTHCPHGHELPPKTVPGVRRGQCRTCERDRYHRRMATRKVEQ